MVFMFFHFPHSRLLDSFNLTYQKDLMVSQEELASGRVIQKEKKKVNVYIYTEMMSK